MMSLLYLSIDTYSNKNKPLAIKIKMIVSGVGTKGASRLRLFGF